MKKPSFSRLIQCIILCLLTFTIVPERIYAQEAVACMKDANGNITENFYSIQDAMNGSRRGAIHMLTDWDLGAQINIVEGTTSIIYMDGHTIKKTNGEKADGSEGGIFTLHPNSKLYLYGSTEEKVFTDSKNNTVTSGGLVTGGYAYAGGAIYMKEAAKLYLTNVAISGNSSEYRGGGIYIEAHAEDCEIWMDKAHIDNNIANNYGGGGIFSNADGTHIHMSNNSTINHNIVYKTGSDGGGVAFNYSWFSLEGDGTCEISYNEVIPGDYGDGTTGGGVYVAEKKLASNFGFIKGLTIKGNYAGQGGGIEAHPRNLYLEDVTITENKSKIRGGGLFVLYDIDIYLKGNVRIYNNHRTDGANDDVFLQSAFGQAYIINSGLSKDSLIGIRTETTGDRLVVKNIIDSDVISCFFLNETSKYHIGCQTSDKELWQRNGTTTYTVKANGKVVGSYVEGTQNVTVVDTSSLFSSWQANNDIKIDSSQFNSNVISFVMPAKNVELTAEYVDASTDIYLQLNELTVGGAFPSQAALYWSNTNFGCKKDIDITWYKNTESGYQKVESTETVQEGVDYFFTTTIKKVTNSTHRIAFSDDFQASDIKIKYGNKTINVASYSLNDEGTLSLSTGSVIDDSEETVYVNQINISMDWPTVGEKLPTTIGSIKAQLNGTTTDIASNLAITSWNHDKGGDTVKNNCLYQANIQLDSLDSTSIDLLKNYDVVINDGTKSTYSYVDQQEGVYYLHIVFCATSSFTDAYVPHVDDDLSYTLDSVLVGDYTKTISYEEAVEINNDLSKFDLPSLLLKVNGYEEKAFSFGSSKYELVSAFNPSNANAQKIVIKGQINLPSYVSNPNNLDTNVTLTINVEAMKDAYLPNKEDVKAKITLSDDEYNKINNNEATLDANLYISDENVSEEDKALVNKNLGNYKLGKTLDLTLFKTITYNNSSTNPSTTQVYQTSGDIEVTITITDALINKAEGVDRTYKVLRIHDNKVDTLDASFNPVNKTITFKTNKFSTYALVYKDTIRNNNTGSSLTCEEYMGSNDWTWSETKKACVYRVSNTSSK